MLCLCCIGLGKSVLVKVMLYLLLHLVWIGEVIKDGSEAYRVDR